MLKNKIKNPKIHKEDENIKKEDEHSEKHEYIGKMILFGKMYLLTKMISWFSTLWMFSGKKYLKTTNAI